MTFPLLLAFSYIILQAQLVEAGGLQPLVLLLKLGSVEGKDWAAELLTRVIDKNVEVAVGSPNLPYMRARPSHWYCNKLTDFFQNLSRASEGVLRELANYCFWGFMACIVYPKTCNGVYLLYSGVVRPRAGPSLYKVAYQEATFTKNEISCLTRVLTDIRVFRCMQFS